MTGLVYLLCVPLLIFIACAVIGQAMVRLTGRDSWWGIPLFVAIAMPVGVGVFMACTFLIFTGTQMLVNG